MRKILLLLIFCLVPAPALAWQEVESMVLVHELEDIFSRDDLRKAAYQQAFRLAVRQEALDMLPQGVDETRMTAFMDYISPEIDNMIQGYRGVRQHREPDFLSMEMEVKVDSETLAQMLKRSGFYYTSRSSWSYNLSTRGASPDDFGLLMDLQTITGVAVDSEGPVSLRLVRSNEQGWKGSISLGEHSRQASASELEELWFRLWGYVFSLPEVESMFVQTYLLETAGWSSSRAVQNFDAFLRERARDIESGVLVQMEAESGSLRAEWEVKTLAPESVEKYLELYLKPRGISFYFESVPRKEP
ncbi:MAG: hypothetical protein ACOCV7_00395 [Desulfonatronovibrionaceae bacterium]